MVLTQHAQLVAIWGHVLILEDGHDVLDKEIPEKEHDETITDPLSKQARAIARAGGHSTLSGAMRQ
jgi:hypothetical protein